LITFLENCMELINILEFYNNMKDIFKYENICNVFHKQAGYLLESTKNTPNLYSIINNHSIIKFNNIYLKFYIQFTTSIKVA
jgi:hypothetical protein